MYERIADHVTFRGNLITKEHVKRTCRFDLCSFDKYKPEVIRTYTNIQPRYSLYKNMQEYIDQIQKKHSNMRLNCFNFLYLVN